MSNQESERQATFQVTFPQVMRKVKDVPLFATMLKLYVTKQVEDLGDLADRVIIAQNEVVNALTDQLAEAEKALQLANLVLLGVEAVGRKTEPDREEIEDPRLEYSPPESSL